MKHDSLHQQAIREITERLISTGNMDGTLENCPGMKERVSRLIGLLRSAMYPHIFGTSSRRGSAASAIAVSYNLQSAAELARSCRVADGELLEMLRLIIQGRNEDA